MTTNFRYALLAALMASSLCVPSVLAGEPVLLHRTERPTLNPYDGDPRPDILPYYIHHRIPEYRRVYNRPRFWGGFIAHVIEPTSQEAMVWEENLHAGAYDGKHCPPRYKRYFAPKPWEVLQTSSRPDFPEREALVPSASELEEQATDAAVEVLETPDETVPGVLRYDQ